MALIWKILLISSVICHISSSYEIRAKRSAEFSFSDAEKSILQDTWHGTITPHVEENAANLMIYFVETYPQYRDMFYWGRNDKSDMALRVSPGFVQHSHAIFSAVGVGIDRLDNLASLDHFYEQLGEDHIPRGINEGVFAPMKEAFVHILGLALGDKFTDEAKAAYGKYYDHIAAKMLEGFQGGDAEPLAGITDAEKAAAVAGWNVFAEDIETNGAATFITLVNAHPALLDVFPWGHEEISPDNAHIRRHAEQVFNGIGVAVGRIDHIHSLDAYYASLGLRHVARKAQVAYFDYIQDALMQTFEQLLGGDYTADFKQGFGKVYGYIVGEFLGGLRGSGELTAAEKDDVRAGFAAVGGQWGEFGAKVFSRLITLHPDMRSKFPWGSKSLSAAALAADPDVQKHGSEVFRAFALTVSNLDDIHGLSDYYYNEGMEHIVRSIETEDFENLGSATVYTFEHEIGDLFTSNFKKGLESLFAFVVENMQRGINGEQTLDANERNELAAAWNKFEVNLEDNGVDVFLNLVHDHPDLLYAFPWGKKGLSAAALRSDPDIHRHASLVFNAVAVAFHNLNNLDSLYAFYIKTGNDHLDRNIPPITFSYLLDAFHTTFHRILGTDYSKSFEHSFDFVYNFVANKMLEGMSGTKTLSDKQKDLIRSAWRQFSQNLGPNGALVFLKFVHDFPETLKTFPWGRHDEVNYEDMFVSFREFGVKGLDRDQYKVYEEMEQHAQQVFGAVAVAVDAIDNLDSLGHYYNSLGVRHIPRSVTPEHFIWMGDAIMYGFQHVLGLDYTAEFETAFHTLYNFIIKNMDEGLAGGISLTQNEADALRAGFAAAEGHLGEIGANTFANLIADDDSYRQRFPWANDDLTIEQIRTYGPAVAHGAKVLGGVSVTVKNLGRLNSFVSYFVDEGVKHVPRQVTEDDFEAFNIAVLPAFQNQIGALYTSDFKNGLTALLGFITENMAKGLALSSVANIVLEENEVQDLQAAWAEVSGDLGTFGAHVFGHLVHDHPDIRSYFPWGRNEKSEAELVAADDTHAHAAVVFGAVGKVIDAADQLKDFQSFLVYKGMQHIPRGVKPEHFDWLKASLVAELKKEVGTKLTPAGASGLNKVYDFIVQTMLKGLTGTHHVSFAEKVALERGWNVFDEHLGENGAKVFVKFLKDNPSFRAFFPWARNDKTYDELLEDSTAQHHAEQVFGAIGAAIHHADNLDATAKYYYDLGVNHLSRAVGREHFPPMKVALEAVLKSLIGDLYTSEFGHGLETVYDFIAEHMIEGLGDSTDLTAHQKDNIRDAFATFQHDLTKYGADTFIYLITEHPDLKAVFPWGDIPNDQLRGNPVFQHHIESVFKGLAVAVDHLDNLKSTASYYVHLGQSHITRGANDAAFAAVIESVLHTFKGILGAKYTDDFSTSFTQLLDFVVGNMKIGLEGQTDVDIVDITEAEQAAVTSGFKTIGDVGDFGRKVFVTFVNNHPETRDLFPWGRNDLSEAALLESAEVKKHAAAVFGAVAAGVERIDTLGTLSGYYKNIGVKHIPRHLEHENFAWMEAAINEVLHAELGAAYTTDFEHGWGKVISFIVGKMELGMSGGKALSAAQKEEVAKAWSTFAADLEGNGAAVFARYVMKYPELKQYFPWGNNAATQEAYEADAGTKAHAAQVFGLLNTLLSDLSNLGDHRSDLVALGRRHIPRHVTMDMMLRMGVVLDEYFDELLGDAASQDFHHGWDLIYANIIDNMVTGLKLHR